MAALKDGLSLTGTPPLAFTPTVAKYRPPILRSELVVREELLARLSQAKSKPLVLVTAPPGYGKSTLVAHWSLNGARPVAWLSLDETDNDPTALLRSIALALHAAAPVSDELRSALYSRDPQLSEVVMPLLSREMATRGNPVVVLDDVHLLRSKEASEWLKRFLWAAQSTGQVVLIGRQIPRLAIGRVRAEGKLEEIDSGALVLSVTEAEALLQNLGLSLDSHDVEFLVARTEGWVAGLHLAALAMTGPADLRSSVTSFGGSDRIVAEYLRDELLDQLPEDLVTFLTRTSILDELSGPLCDAVLDTTGSGRVLGRIAGSNNLFLLPLDREGNWYRYHHLFAELLRSELQSREGDSSKVLHQRASTWYAANGQVTKAVQQAREAGELRRAGDLMLGHILEFADRGEIGTVGAWFESLSDAQMESAISLTLARAWFEISRGNLESAERWIEAAAAAHWEGALADGSPSLDVALAMLRAGAGSTGLRDLARDAALVRELGPAGSVWFPLACLLHATAVVLMGDLESGRTLMHEVERVSRGIPIAHIGSLVHLALIATEHHDWDEAASLADRAITEQLENGLESFRPSVLAHAVSSLTQAKKSNKELALRRAGHAIGLLGSPGDIPSRTRLEVLTLLAEMEVILGDRASAVEFGKAAEEEFNEDKEALLMRGRLDRLWARIESKALGDGQVPILTPAELRVLALLPTHLTLGEIATALYLSRNTVKTHAIALYRKLGASARGPAVARARELGYLDP